MVDVVIPLWDKVVTVEASVLEGFFRAVHTLYALFYADDKLLAHPMQDRLQAALNIMKDLLDRVGTQRNLFKMVGMTCLT